jgi:hypothetical protein
MKLNAGAENSPGRNLSPTTNSFSAIGMIKAVYCAMAPMLKTAPMATGLANMSRPSRAPIVMTNQTALTGVLVYRLTCFHQRLPGRAPSRE